MKSKTLIEKQLKKKTNPILVETVLLAKKNKAWNQLAAILTGSRRTRANINLSKVDSEANDGEVIIVPGKVLSLGEQTKKYKVAALSFSSGAEEKLKDNAVLLLDEIKSNPEAKGIKILK